MSASMDCAKGNIVAVVASNDGTAGGAIQALEDHKLAGKVLVSAQDADLAAIIRILDGTQTMRGYKPLGSQATQAAEAAVAWTRGDRVRTTTDISIGNKTIAAALLRPLGDTQDNVTRNCLN